MSIVFIVEKNLVGIDNGLNAVFSPLKNTYMTHRRADYMKLEVCGKA